MNIASRLQLNDQRKEYNIEYNVWQASKTVSANGRVISLTSMPYNKDLEANDLYKIVLVVSGIILHISSSYLS